MSIITQEQMLSALNGCYNKALDGVLNTKSAKAVAEEYVCKYGSNKLAAEKFLSNQIMKCGTSGFLTGLGGVMTLPVAIPANITSVLYIQLRMISVIAYIGGHNPKDDEVQTMAYLCLTGTSMGDIAKSAGIQIGKKVSTNLIKKIPGKVLTQINQKVGFRLITKAGEKGIINMTKMVPLLGGVIGGGLDMAGTKIVGKKAIDLFIDGYIE